MLSDKAIKVLTDWIHTTIFIFNTTNDIILSTDEDFRGESYYISKIIFEDERLNLDDPKSWKWQQEALVRAFIHHVESLNCESIIYKLEITQSTETEFMCKFFYTIQNH